jgi:hypothetical protein
MGEGVPWGNMSTSLFSLASKEACHSKNINSNIESAGGTGGHSFTSSGLPPSLARKDYGSIF